VVLAIALNGTPDDRRAPSKRYGVTGDLLGQPILADLPGVRIYA
jgi:hypothetical protein